LEVKLLGSKVASLCAKKKKGKKERKRKLGIELSLDLTKYISQEKV
jgi:hypothetical protein